MKIEVLCCRLAHGTLIHIHLTVHLDCIQNTCTYIYVTYLTVYISPGGGIIVNVISVDIYTHSSQLVTISYTNVCWTNNYKMYLDFFQSKDMSCSLE